MEVFEIGFSPSYRITNIEIVCGGVNGAHGVIFRRGILSPDRKITTLQISWPESKGFK